MCGIAGIIFSESTPVDLTPALSRMRDAIRHRGPDDNGIALLPGAAGGFVNTRLAILDLSSAGHQPMTTPDGRYLITFNGEIYNFNELRDELVAGGIEFKSHSDTEVILRLFERDGPSCVNRLVGMFAFAIWDAQEKTCFLARDPLGIKPLYYSAFPRDLIFASEVRALLQSDRIPKRISSESLFNYFLNGTWPSRALSWKAFGFCPPAIICFGTTIGSRQKSIGRWNSRRHGQTAQSPRNFFERRCFNP